MKVSNSAPTTVSPSKNGSRAANTNLEDRFSADYDLFIVRVTPGFHTIVKRNSTPLVLSNVLPIQFRDLVPSPSGNSELEAGVEMTCERLCFFIDRLPSGPGQLPCTSQLNCWLSCYDYATDTKRALVNVSAESGVHEFDHFQVVRLDMRPGSMDLNSHAKFLCTLELSNG